MKLIGIDAGMKNITLALLAMPDSKGPLTYTVKHIQKGLTLWANKKSNANGMPLCLFCSIWSKRIERIARYDKENLLW